MNDFPKVTEAIIRQRSKVTSFERGQEYYESGAVLSEKIRGNQIFAEVEGSSYEPYQVSVRLNESGITSTQCSCPYDLGGDCKHIVAVLLSYIHSPKDIKVQPTVEELISKLNRDELYELVIELVNHNPDLADIIEEGFSEAHKEPMEPATRERRVELDPESIRKQIHSAIRPHSYRDRYDYEYDDEDEGIASDLQSFVDKAQTFVKAGDGRSALTILQVVIEEYIDDFEDTDWYNDEPDTSFLEDVGELLAEAILTADLTQKELKKWENALKSWDSELDDCGFSDVLNVALEAAKQGWDFPPLKRVLEGDITDLGAWDKEAPFYADKLAIARLNVLERQGRTQEYLYLAEAEGQTDRYVTMLAKLGRAQEAIDYSLKYVDSRSSILTIAQSFHEKGDFDSAFLIAEHGLNLPKREYYLDKLPGWLRDAAAAAGQKERALKAALIAMEDQPSLINYQAVRELSDERWPELKEKILIRLREAKSGNPTANVEIFLSEGLVDDAITSLKGNDYYYDLVKRVADAAISIKPDWVIETCRRQAEAIMDATKSNAYQYAVDWLKRVKEAYKVSDRQSEWQKYLSELLDKHKRKRNLVPMLKEMQ